MKLQHYLGSIGVWNYNSHIRIYAKGVWDKEWEPDDLYPKQILLVWLHHRRDVWYIQHILGTRKIYTGFWCGRFGTTGKPEHNWVNIIKMDLKETGLEVLEWIELAQNRNIPLAVLNAVMKPRIPSNQRIS